MTQFCFETSPRIICERYGVQRLGEISRNLGMTRVFVVTDAGLLKAGLLDSSVQSMKSAGLDVKLFSEVLADPPEESIERAVAAATAYGADGVIGFGGGSSMDTAKLVALLTRTPQSLVGIYGVELAKGPRLPLIQIPTTAGTGSEVTPISILTTPSHEKKGVVSPLLYPDIALLDSHLTLGLPPAVTAMTGVDAMVHAIEAYTTRHKKNPLSDAMAKQALQLLFSNLPQAVRVGSDALARENMLIGSLMAGMAFANAPVAAVHALAYPLGGHFHLPHGLSNSLVLVPVLRFNMEAAQSQYAELGRIICPDLVTAGDAQAAEGFVNAIAACVAQMPYSQTLREAGITQADLETLAEDAMKVQRLLVNNPRELTYEDALNIYRLAY